MLKSLYVDLFRPPSERQIGDFLVTIPLFVGLTKKEADFIARQMYRRTFADKEIVFAEGDKGSAMYVILNGSVSILKRTNRGLSEIARLQEGSFFGEMALLTNLKRSATARANGVTSLLCLFKKDLDHVVEQHHATGVVLMKNLASVLAQRLAHSLSEREEQ